MQWKFLDKETQSMLSAGGSIEDGFFGGKSRFVEFPIAFGFGAKTGTCFTRLAHVFIPHKECKHSTLLVIVRSWPRVIGGIT